MSTNKTSTVRSLNITETPEQEKARLMAENAALKANPKMTLAQIAQAQAAARKPKAQVEAWEAPDVSVNVEGEELTLRSRQFASGSLGWNYGGPMMVHGVECQVSLNIVVKGSKPKAAK